MPKYGRLRHLLLSVRASKFRVFPDWTEIHRIRIFILIEIILKVNVLYVWYITQSGPFQDPIFLQQLTQKKRAALNAARLRNVYSVAKFKVL